MTVGTVRARRRRLHADAPTVAVDVFLGTLKLFLLVVTAWALLGMIVLQSQGQLLSGAAWRDVISGGLVQGSVYGLIALGYSMVYGILGFINFAHGEVFMAGALSGALVATALFDSGLWTSAFPIAFLIVLFAGMLTSGILAILTERIAYRPLRNAPRLIPLITSIGVSFFLQYAVRGLFGAAFRRYPDFPAGLGRRYSVLGLAIPGDRLAVIVVAGISLVALWWFVTRSRTGRAIRAVAEDKEIAALMGINVDRTIVTTFAVGGVMAGIAGIMWALIFQSVYFLSGFLPGIKAFTAAVLGGIGNLPGSMLGGLILGMMEAAGPTMLTALRWPIPTWLAYAVGVASVGVAVVGFRRLSEHRVHKAATAATYLVVGSLMAVLSFIVLPGAQIFIPGASQLKDLIAFVVLIGVLMIRPVGLLGERLSVEERG